MIRYTIATGRRAPRPVAWFDLADARTGRKIGMFLSIDDARDWIVRRPPWRRFWLALWFNGRLVSRFRCRSTFGGRVDGIDQVMRGEGRP